MTTQCGHCGCEIKPDSRPLNDIMEFDHPVQVGPDGTVTDHVPGVYAPELVMETDDDGQILDEHEQDYTEQARRQGWEPLTGWTGQYSYHGPVMHPSEYVGGALADHIRETPGTYVVVTVECDQDSEPAGWAVLRRIEPEQPEPAGDPAADGNADGSPYAHNTPEHRTWVVARNHAVAAAAMVFGQGHFTQADYRRVITATERGGDQLAGLVTPPEALRRDDGDGYCAADLMSAVGWVPHDGTWNRDDLSAQYDREVKREFWTLAQDHAMRGYRGHRVVGDTTQLGNRFLECACGHSTSGGAGDTIARQNMDHHIEQVQKLRRERAS